MVTNINKQKRAFKAQEKAAMSQVVREILEDPDFGLELSEEAKRRLENTRPERQSLRSAANVKEKYY